MMDVVCLESLESQIFLQISIPLAQLPRKGEPKDPHIVYGTVFTPEQFPFPFHMNLAATTKARGFWTCLGASHEPRSDQPHAVALCLTEWALGAL